MKVDTSSGVEAESGQTVTPHRWVAAALVDVGHGRHDRRAERACRTGRYIVPASTRIEVLEVYCGDCRAPYSERIAGLDCAGTAVARVDAGRPTLRAVR